MTSPLSFLKTLFIEPERLSKIQRVKTLAVCAAVIVACIIAMHVNNMAYGQDESTSTLDPTKERNLFGFGHLAKICRCTLILLL